MSYSSGSNMVKATIKSMSSQSQPDADIQRISVVVYTNSAIINGSISCRNSQRLLDTMNKGTVCPKGKNINSDFIQIVDLDIIKPGASLKHLETVFIQKKNILFIGERTDTNCSLQTSAHSFRKKKPIHTIIGLGEQIFTGHVHVEMWEELRNAINTNDQFLPMTDIELNLPLPNCCKQLAFAAINREHITYIGH
jgi:hypothetical protein